MDEDSVIECDCCGQEAGRGEVEDGQALACGCAGRISVDGEQQPCTIIDGDCPPTARCNVYFGDYVPHSTGLYVHEHDGEYEVRFNFEGETVFDTVEVALAAVGEYAGAMVPCETPKLRPSLLVAMPEAWALPLWESLPHHVRTEHVCVVTTDRGVEMPDNLGEVAAAIIVGDETVVRHVSKALPVGSLAIVCPPPTGDRLEHWRKWAELYDPFPEQPVMHDNERRFRVNWWIEMLTGEKPREGRLAVERPTDWTGHPSETVASGLAGIRGRPATQSEIDGFVLALWPAFESWVRRNGWPDGSAPPILNPKKRRALIDRVTGTTIDESGEVHDVDAEGQALLMEMGEHHVRMEALAAPTEPDPLDGWPIHEHPVGRFKAWLERLARHVGDDASRTALSHLRDVVRALATPAAAPQEADDGGAWPDAEHADYALGIADAYRDMAKLLGCDADEVADTCAAAGEVLRKHGRFLVPAGEPAAPSTPQAESPDEDAPTYEDGRRDGYAAAERDYQRGRADERASRTSAPREEPGPSIEQRLADHHSTEPLRIHRWWRELVGTTTVLKAWDRGDLSEGQAAAMLGLDRVAARQALDSWRATERPEALDPWAAAAAKIRDVATHLDNDARGSEGHGFMPDGVRYLGQAEAYRDAAERLREVADHLRDVVPTANAELPEQWLSTMREGLAFLRSREPNDGSALLVRVGADGLLRALGEPPATEPAADGSDLDPIEAEHEARRDAHVHTGCQGGFNEGWAAGVAWSKGRADAARSSSPRRNGDHVTIPSDYPGEPAIHVMRHRDGDFGIAVAEGERWPGKAATMSSSGGRNPAAWEAVAALWKAATEPA